MPRILVIQADNTTAQTKNSKVATFLAWLVASGKFDAVVLNFLLVGHTHEDIDQFFSVLFFLLHRHRKWQSAKALLDALAPELRERFSARNEEFYATALTHIRDFQTWLSPIGCTQYSCWNSRSGIETPHSFSYKRRRDLSGFDLKSGDPFQLQGYQQLPTDVLCCVKTYMRDTKLQDPPVMVMSSSMVQRVTTVVPMGLVARKEWSKTEMTNYMELRNRFRDMNMPIAAEALQHLIYGTQTKEPPTSVWLALRPGAALVPELVDTGNPYFPHLPARSWSMLVRLAR